MLPVDEFSNVYYIRANSGHSRKSGAILRRDWSSIKSSIYTKSNTCVIIHS